MSFYTDYASPERASSDNLQQAIQAFAEFDHLVPFLDAMPVIVLILNEHRQVVFANRALYEVAREIDGEVYGQRPGELLNCAHAVLREGGCGTTSFCRTCGAVNAILASLEGNHAVKECRILQRDGRALDLRAWATPLDWHGARYTIFALEDISAEKRREALEHIFIHDLLNTAGVLLGFTSAFSENILAPTAQNLDTIYRQAVRLVTEIQGQRDLIAAENRELVAQPVPVESLAVLRDVQSAGAYHPAADGRVIVIASDAQNVPFTSDPTLLGRVIGNMVKNALEASKEGETITLSSQREGDAVAFMVHNAGVMPEVVQQQVFKRSFSTKGSGRGLGTYSMKLLTERYLGGRITFESTPECGTTFRAVYPLAWHA